MPRNRRTNSQTLPAPRMNAETRGTILLVAGAVECLRLAILGRAASQTFDRFEWIENQIRSAHAEGHLDFEGFLPVYPDTRGMSFGQTVSALTTYAEECIRRCVLPTVSEGCPARHFWADNLIPALREAVNEARWR